MLEAFGRGSDGRIYRRAHDGANWGTWTAVAALDGAAIDARSDLDCSATLTSVHIVASGLNPVGSILHAFGFGNAYNPFVRELSPMVFDPGPSIGLVGENDILIGGAPGGLFELDGTSTPKQVTPITTQTDAFRSGPDIALQPAGASELRFFAAFDTTGLLAIYYEVVSSAPSYWATPIKLSAPTGSFSFSPAICTENGAFGHYSVNVVAVAGEQLWYATTSSVTSSFSAWTSIAMAPTASPDCVVVGADSTVHVVTLSRTGTVVDINGKGTSWIATDLGLPDNAATGGRGP